MNSQPETGPRRIQRRRAKGWRLPEGAVIVDRSTPFGNPFIPGREIPFLPGRKVQDKRHAASLYHGFAPNQPRLVAAAQEQLRGRDLACWCALCDLHRDGKPMGERCPYCAPCHVDTLIEMANA